jgi:hypothetical protein
MKVQAEGNVIVCLAAFVILSLQELREQQHTEQWKE